MTDPEPIMPASHHPEPPRHVPPTSNLTQVEEERAKDLAHREAKKERQRLHFAAVAATMFPPESRTIYEDVQAFAWCPSPLCEAFPGISLVRDPVAGIRETVHRTYGDNGGGDSMRPSSMTETSFVHVKFAHEEDAACTSCGRRRDITDQNPAGAEIVHVSGHARDFLMTSRPPLVANAAAGAIFKPADPAPSGESENVRNLEKELAELRGMVAGFMGRSVPPREEAPTEAPDQPQPVAGPQEAQDAPQDDRQKPDEITPADKQAVKGSPGVFYCVSGGRIIGYGARWPRTGEPGASDSRRGFATIADAAEFRAGMTDG